MSQRFACAALIAGGCISSPAVPGDHGVARSWHQRQDPIGVAAMPEELTGARLAYDPHRERVLLYGGTYLTEVSDAMYELDPDKGWQLVCDPCLATADPVGQGGRYQPAFLFNPQSGAMTMYGGGNFASGSLAYFGELWELSGDAWHLVPTSGDVPDGRGKAQMVFDPDREALWLLGGYNGSSPIGDVYTLSDHVWRSEAVPPVPAQADPIALASGSISSFYDPEHERIVVLADGNGPGWDELWQHTPLGWQRICEDCVGSTHHDAALIHIPEYDQTFLIGGSDDADVAIAGTKILVDDHFEVYDAAMPPARSVIGAVYDPKRDVIVTYGGAGPVGGDCTTNNICGGTRELRRD